MAVFTVFNSFVEHCMSGVHNFNTAALKIALCNAANPPVVADEVLTDLTQITLTNLVSDALTISDFSTTGNAATITVADFDVEATGGSLGPFRYVAVYDDSAANDELVCFYDLETDVTVASGQSITLDFSQDAGVGMLTIGFP